MMTFSYQARDGAGNIVNGIQDAINEDNAVTSLMSRGLMVLSLQQKAAATRSKNKVWTVKETDLVLFTRQLATMIDAGISLVQALTALYEQCDPKRQKNLRNVISDVTARVKVEKRFTNRSRNIRASSIVSSSAW
jgi:type II secretory pathway component PulF